MSHSSSTIGASCGWDSLYPSACLNPSAGCATVTSEHGQQPMQPLDETERMLSLQMALKCADLGHVTSALPLHIK